MKSILSYPVRGPYGDARYRGNCTGYIIKAQQNTLIENKKYTNYNFIPIVYEHLLIFKKVL